MDQNDLKNKLRANRKAGNILGELRCQTLQQHKHAVDMCKSAHARATLYPQAKDKEERIAKRWSQEADALDRVAKLLVEVQRRLSGE